MLFRLFAVMKPQVLCYNHSKLMLVVKFIMIFIMIFIKYSLHIQVIFVNKYLSAFVNVGKTWVKRAQCLFLGALLL